MKLGQKNLPHMKEVEINYQFKKRIRIFEQQKMSVNKSQEKELLIKNLFKVINEIFIVKPGVTLDEIVLQVCLLYTSPSPRDGLLSRMPSSA